MGTVLYIAELSDITKEYFQHPVGEPNRVLDHISLTVSPDEMIAVTGPSGSGKTTLLNILGSLDQPTSGRVIIDGKPVEGLGEQQLAELRNRFIGFIFQQHMLLPQLTVLENILLPVLPVKEKIFKEEAHARAIELIAQVGLEDHARHYPGRLSVGECQRVAVIRALINKPSLLLADEPTGSLDAQNAAMLAELLVELHEKYHYSLVMVTHDPEVARRMKTHYRLLNGKIQLIS